MNTPIQIAKPGPLKGLMDDKWRAIWYQNGTQRIKVFGRTDRDRIFAERYAALMQEYYNPVDT